MSKPRLLISALAFAAVAACGGGETEPMPPAPTGPTPEELEQMRQDSIAAARAAEAEARRLEEERAAREEAMRLAEAARNTLQEIVYFDYDEAAIRPDTEEKLRNKADVLRRNPGVMLRMEGHADERGTSEYNIALGNERAEAVIQFMSGFGLDASRFTSVSYGEEQPVAMGSDEMSWAQNRRVEFVITAGGNDLR